MPITHISRSADLLPGQVSLPNANAIRVDSDTDTVKHTTGVSGTTEKELMDLSSAQTVTGVKTFTGANVFSTLPVMSADGGLQYAEVALTAAQIKALRATPITMVAAPGAGKMLRFIGAILLLDFGTGAFAENGGGSNLGFRYVGAAGVKVSDDVESTGFIDAVADTSTQARAKNDVIALKTEAENQLICLHNIGAGEIVTGDGVLRVKVFYAVVSTGF